MREKNVSNSKVKHVCRFSCYELNGESTMKLQVTWLTYPCLDDFVEEGSVLETTSLLDMKECFSTLF